MTESRSPDAPGFRIMPSMRIGELAGRAGVGVETVRYYQRRGLMPRPSRPIGGIRRYSEADLARLLFIRRAKQLGFSLKDIRILLALDAKDCEEVRRLAELKLADVESRIKDLHAVADSLRAMIDQCEHAGQAECPIIESLVPRNP